MNTRYFIS